MQVHDDGERAGTCDVIWDSDQCHTRALHSKLGNRHAAGVGAGGEYHLVLAEQAVCEDISVREHRIVEGGIGRTHLQVIMACRAPTTNEGVGESLAGGGQREEGGESAQQRDVVEDGASEN